MNILFKFFLTLIACAWVGYASAQPICSKFENDAPGFLQFLKQKLGSYLYPETKEDFMTVISEDDTQHILDFAKLAKKAQFTTYSNTPCPVNKICKLSSVDAWLRVLVVDLDKMNLCVERKCSPGEATAIMLSLQSTYKDIEAELISCIPANN